MDWFGGRRRRRNPAVFGLKIEDGIAGAAGIYATKNGGALLGRVVPQLGLALDGVKAGLSRPVLEGVAAVIVDRVGKAIAPKYRAAATLGASAVVMSDALLAALGQVDLLEGRPSWAGWGKPKEEPKSGMRALGTAQSPISGQLALTGPSGYPAGVQSGGIGQGTMGF